MYAQNSANQNIDNKKKKQKEIGDKIRKNFDKTK